eukprot:TRINITY_DN703_c0_g4_i1.p1 TRINITY_DN703_c0_g4~~TRINITY_DN703_c0_g4_i1.p1  ORF type:complete len:145 (+),score=20.02 TRINITY_DN703_c0_g4_i1:29-463(+)
MPKYYCDYCDIFLTHDSPSVRKSHNEGWKHKWAVRAYYGQFEENHTQSLIDQKIKEFEASQGGYSAGFQPVVIPGAAPPPYQPMAGYPIPPYYPQFGRPPEMHPQMTSPVPKQPPTMPGGTPTGPPPGVPMSGYPPHMPTNTAR